jgi:hypothetical protein
MADQIEASQSQVADKIEDLVTGRLIRKTQTIIDQALWTEYEDFRRLQMSAYALSLQFNRFVFQNIGAAASQL